MTARKRRLLLLLAAYYGLAVTVSGLLHDHGGPSDRSCCHTTSPEGDHLDHGEKKPQHGPDGHGPVDDDHCFVCHFLAQKPIAVAQTEVTASESLDYESVLPAPIRPRAHFLPAWHIRGPPGLA